mgnify:CR=1 FL=1
MVNITIDGKTLSVPEGTTVLQAARSADIHIPTLCDHTELKPYGGCRLCLVEVEGARTLQPSCTLPVSNNMVVKTATDRVKAARKFVLTLIFSERNHFCPFCQVSGGDCELQNAAYAEEMTHWQLQPNWQPYPVDASHPYFVLDNNRCILCRRCVRACGELVGNFTLGFEERGARSVLVADLGTPLGSSSCISCGVCLQVCPTGALIDRWSAYKGHEENIEKIDTICTGCSVGCGMSVWTRNNNLVKIGGIWGAPAGEGLLCEIGRFKPVAETPERIHTPLIRRYGALKAATWDEAIKTVVDQLKKANGKIAAAASTKLPAEALHLFKQIFVDGLHGNSVTSLEEGQATAINARLADEMGTAYETRVDKLNQADSVFVMGADLVKNHQVVGFLIKRALPLGTSLVVVDHTENALGDQADFYFKPATNLEAEFLHALTAGVVQLGLAKKEIKVAENILESIAAKVGIAADDILEAARLLAAAEHPVFVIGKGVTQSETLKAVLNLATVTGAELISLKGEANSLVASQYHLDQPLRTEGQAVVFIACADEDISQRFTRRMEGVPCLIVQSSNASQLTAMADVVLPVENWMEQEGHFINLDGLVQKASPSRKSDEGIQSAVETYREMAKLLNIHVNEEWRQALASRTSVVEIISE